VPRRRRRHFERARGFTSLLTGRRSSGRYGRFGATASAAHIEFSHINDSRVNWSNAMRAAHAVAPNLAYPPQWRLPTTDVKPLARSKCRLRRRGAPPCRSHARGGGRFPVLLPPRDRNRLWFGPTKRFRVGRCMANRRPIYSKTVSQWVYTMYSSYQTGRSPFKFRTTKTQSNRQRPKGHCCKQISRLPAPARASFVLVGRVIRRPPFPECFFSSFVCGRAGPTCCVRSIEESPNPPHLPGPLVGANCRLPEGPPVGDLHVVRRRVYRSSRGRTRGWKPHVVRWSTDCPPVGNNSPLIVFDRPGGDPNGSRWCAMFKAVNAYAMTLQACHLRTRCGPRCAVHGFPAPT
jgi:hypothetical protein